MTMSMYRASVPVFLQMLPALSAVLDKAAAHAAAKKIDPQVFIEARLYPDMFPLNRQIMIATDFAKGACARLAGVEPPKYADTEKSFDELKARIAKTVDFIKEFKPSQIDGSEERESPSRWAASRRNSKARPISPASCCRTSSST